MSDLHTFQFSKLKENQYLIVDDSVMGGVSNSQFQIDNNFTLYSGNVSLENNGGFASVRMLWPFTTKQSKQKSLIKLRFKADGRRYQLRLRTDNRFDGAAYVQSFGTFTDQEQTVYLSIDDFVPQFRGRKLSGMPALKLSEVRQMGIMIADKQEGDFSIELVDLTIK